MHASLASFWCEQRGPAWVQYLQGVLFKEHLAERSMQTCGSCTATLSQSVNVMLSCCRSQGRCSRSDLCLLSMLNTSSAMSPVASAC